MFVGSLTRGFYLVALFVLIAESVKVTPVEKVTELLENLAKKIEQEGQADAVAYDKYACFCKQQADDKLYAIETSNKTISQQTAKIDELSADISGLDGQIQDLGAEILRLRDEMARRHQQRTAEHENFTIEMEEIDDAIDTVERAIAALADSKKALVGRAELEAISLPQVAIAARAMLSDAAVDRMSSFASAGQPGDAYTYQYHSNDIIATLRDVLSLFKRRKGEVEANEWQAETRYTMNQRALDFQYNFTGAERGMKVREHDSKSQEKAVVEFEKYEETKDMVADKAFLGVLQGGCESKAGLWDQRSQTRANELTAISTAVEALKTGVAPNWQANKKLVGLQKSSVVKGHWVYVDEKVPAASAPSASFLQIRGVSLRGAANSQSSGLQLQLASKVHQSLLQAAEELKSPVLSIAALKVHAAEDHFVKVRQIIKDLISQLEDQATAEATHKSFCDKEMSATVTRRDDEQRTAESLDADIHVKESDKARLKNEIAELSKQIASLQKALADATTLWLEEQKEYRQTIVDAGAGKAAVELALNTLRAFYSNPAMLQHSSGYVPPKSDREGLTVADRAPDVFDAEYKGSQDASKGIIGLLEVILADFDRTSSTVGSQENQAQWYFEDFERVNEQDAATIKNSETAKDSQVTTIDDEIVGLTDNLKSAQGAHAAALATLEKLHSMCIQGEETYAERVAHRQKEIEALKQAHGILEGWQK